MENLRVSGTRELVTVTLQGVPNEPGIAATVLGALGEHALNVEMVVASGASAKRSDILVAAARSQRDQIMKVAEQIRKDLGARGVVAKDGAALVTLSGSELASQPGIAGKMFRALSDEGINIGAISTSLSSITCLIDEDRIEDALAVLGQQLAAAR